MNENMELISNEKLNVRTYLNIFQYLNDYFNERKLKNSHFSYEIWATELGFKSKSSVRMICQEKRQITDKFINAFAEKEKLTTAEKDYLMLLSYYSKIGSVIVKKSLLEKIFAQYDLKKSEKNIKDCVAFLASSDVPVLQLMISFKDFKATEENLAAALNMSTAKLKTHLSTLESLDLIQKITSEASVESYWVSKNKLFRIPEEIGSPAISLFHQETMQEALKKATMIHQNYKFRSIYFSISEDKFQDACHAINEFANRMKAEFCNDFIQDKQVYKMNFQLYPITEKIKLPV